MCFSETSTCFSKTSTCLYKKVKKTTILRDLMMFLKWLLFLLTKQEHDIGFLNRAQKKQTKPSKPLHFA